VSDDPVDDFKAVAKLIRAAEAQDFVSDAEIARRWHVSDKIARVAIAAFERNPRFPKRDALMAGKRYWPAVCQFMRARYGLASLPAPVDGEEHFENDPARRRRVARR
jgi:hypothetical protein